MTTINALPDWYEEWYEESLRTGQVTTTTPLRYNALYDCRWCNHVNHGLPCRTSRCGCESAFTSRDDSWRPHTVPFNDKALLDLMHNAGGLDGFTARALLIQGPTTSRLRQLITTPPKDSP